MKAIVHTTVGKSSFQDTLIPFASDAQGIENQVVNLYPELTFETFEGFGGAITDAAGYVYAQMDPAQREQVMRAYFSPEGLNYNRVRIPLDSCDFSTGMYEAMSDPTDRALRSFSFARTEQYILPMLRDAERAAGHPLKLTLSPWSPPTFMKTNHDRKYGGSLKPEFYEFFADYLCRYVLEFQRRGFQVERLSLQNEAKAVQTWDSCVYTAQQEKTFLKTLYAAFCRHGLEKQVELFIWDHNKERAYERAEEIIDSETEKMVSGVACHWYSGDHFESLDLLRTRFPSLRLVLSESCLEYRFFDAKAEESNAARLSHEITGDLNHGITAFYDWNLLLDEKGGPNHVGNFCDAPFRYDTRTGVLEQRMLYQYFYHFAHFIRPGAQRIGMSRYTDQLDVAACRNKDGTLVAVLLNRGNEALPAVLRLNGEIAQVTVPAGGIATVSIV
ncbi:MAG: glucosylceramidase [Clostridiales bacterium]|nr:glucosylceramidase [Clostridiales bacterium]